MEVWGSSPWKFYAISLLFVVPYLFFSRKSVFPTTPTLPQPSTLLRPILTILVLLHSLHTLKLLLSPPVNLFTKLNLPLTAPVSTIRVALLESQRDKFPVGFLNKISPDVEVLLSRLASFEARVVYVKYGSYPLTQCTPCVHLSDFALFALAPSVLPYLRVIILISLITCRATSRRAWRTPSLVCLIAALFTEAWWTLDGNVQFRDEKLDGWTHTETYIVRHTLLLLLPFFIHHLPEHSSPSVLPPFYTCDPPRPTFPHQSSDFRLFGAHTPQTPPRGGVSPSRSMSTQKFPSADSSTQTQDSETPDAPGTPVTALAGTIASLRATISTLRVLEWARIAGLRRNSLREKMSSYYATDKLDATYARSDEQLRHQAEQLGMGYRRGRERFSPQQRFGGSSSTWQGNDDPRGLDGDGMLDDNDEDPGDDAHSHHRRRREEAEVTQSPLRARAKKTAQELAARYFRGDRSGS